LFDLGFFSGISTNPSILKRTGRRPLEVIQEMLKRFSGSLFVQCASRNYDEVIREGKELFKLDPKRIILKIPFSRTGIRVSKRIQAAEDPCPDYWCFLGAAGTNVSRSRCRLRCPIRKQNREPRD
jgi:transaldolase